MAISKSGNQPITFLSIGFRPFFLAAGLYAIFSMIAWMAWLALHASNAVILTPTIAGPPHLWHGHEMVFGFASAVISGFLLTAVPGWTGTQPINSLPLLSLGLIWLAGRAALWFSAFLHAPLVALIDLAFLPLLWICMALSFIERPARQNLIVLLLVAVLIYANLLVHFEWIGWSDTSATRGLAIAVITITLMMVILGGRAVPSFTHTAPSRRGNLGRIPKQIKFLDLTSSISVAAVLICYLVNLPHDIIAICAMVGSGLNFLRLLLWHGYRRTAEPILWSLYLVYFWIPVGLAAFAYGLLTEELPVSAALHILAVGAIGGMTLAIMTRVPLGHTGRPLTVSAPISCSYLLIAMAALLRGFGPSLFLSDYFTVVLSAGLLWVIGFIIFAAGYTSVLVGPNVDT